ncbi:MAG TPA: DUF3445 domain-containing protein [Cyclobacteriaceae bacterium]
MLRYFPFTEKFDLKMGTSPLPGPDRLIECDEHYLTEVAIKRKLLEEDQRYYFRAAPETLPYQWEVIDIVLTSLITTYPENFKLIKTENQWSWENKLLNENYAFEFGNETTLPLPPLDWVGRQIQEDLLILNQQLILIAGSLCFPSGWDLDGKMNKNFFDIHGPLPSLTNVIIETANKFIERIPIGKAFQRNNWGFRITDQLDLSARHTANYQSLLSKISSEMNEDNAGEKIFVRVEHQTLSRLPKSGMVLFTIHTIQNKLSEEVKDKARAKTMYSFLSSVPEKLLEYKVMTPFVPALLNYLKIKSAD